MPWLYLTIFQIIAQIISFFIIVILLFKLSRNEKQSESLQQQLNQSLPLIIDRLTQLQSARNETQEIMQQQALEQKHQREEFDKHQVNSLKVIQDSLSKGIHDAQQHIQLTLKQHGESLSKHIAILTQETQQSLKAITGEVNSQLSKGFEKTTATFTDVMKRLTIIDQAQQKITELSSNVVSLQDILNDKRSRGAFGEIQLHSLIKNTIPEQHFSMQHSLSNGKRVDCLLFLPEPTGNMSIDAKFPLETYKKIQHSDQNKSKNEQQFKVDIKKHINDIANKYIIPGETADGAMMFLPSESIFSEIHSNYPELIELAHRSCVWIVSPSTMMAVLTTAKAVLKDAATRKQVHIIQQHLNSLAGDFSRFQSRMDNLSKHINQAQQDVEQVHVSSKKISSKFAKIEQVELKDELLAIPSSD